MAQQFTWGSAGEYPTMSNYIIDADPMIPTGMPADPVQVGILILGDILPADALPNLVAEQQPTPEDLGQACVQSPMATAEAAAKLEEAGLTVSLPE